MAALVLAGLCQPLAGRIREEKAVRDLISKERAQLREKYKIDEYKKELELIRKEFKNKQKDLRDKYDFNGYRNARRELRPDRPDRPARPPRPDRPDRKLRPDRPARPPRQQEPLGSDPRTWGPSPQK